MFGRGVVVLLVVVLVILLCPRRVVDLFRLF